MTDIHFCYLVYAMWLNCFTRSLSADARVAACNILSSNMSDSSS